MFCDCNVVFRAALTAASEGKAHPTTSGNKTKVELPINKQKSNALVSLREFESWIVPLATLIWSSIRGGDRHHHVCDFCHCKGLSPSPPMPSLRSKVSSTMHMQKVKPLATLGVCGCCVSSHHHHHLRRSISQSLLSPDLFRLKAAMPQPPQCAPTRPQERTRASSNKSPTWFHCQHGWTRAANG